MSERDFQKLSSTFSGYIVNWEITGPSFDKNTEQREKNELSRNYGVKGGIALIP